jgi:PST family polysaccharide transporter
MTTTDAVHERIVRGGLALGVRHVALAVVHLAGGIALARLLTPVEFGLYAVLLTIGGFQVALSDVGFFASLVRRAEEPEDADFSALLGLQLTLGAVLAAVACAAAPHLVTLYDRPPGEVPYFRLAAFVAPLGLLASPCSLRMERRLQFGRIAAVELSGSIAFYATAVSLAVRGGGAACFAWALIARSAVVVVVAHVMSPRWPRPAWRWDRVRPHLAFGLPHQASGLLGAAAASVNSVLVALTFGLDDAGLIAWATTLSYYLGTAVGALARLLTAGVPRLQHDPPAMVRGLNHAYAGCAFALFAGTALLGGLAPMITDVVYSAQWRPALPALYALLVSSAFQPLAVPTRAAAFALGWSGTMLGVNAARTGLLWAGLAGFSRVLSATYAYGAAVLAIELTEVPLYVRLVRRLPGVSAVRAMAPSLIASVSVVALLQLAHRRLPAGFATLAALAAGGLAVYAAASLGLSRLLGEPIQNLLRAGRGRLP